MNAETYPTPEHGWTCFHCGETFPGTMAGHQDARRHFGASIHDEPKCQISARRLRDMEAQLRCYREEDTDLHREIAKLQAAHPVALRREEEKGYARGVADRTAEFKNFHRLLCERFGYGHDPLDWQRDQLSLIEHIAKAVKT